jgi:hypothetical protein
MIFVQKIRVNDRRNFIVNAHGASAFANISSISPPPSPRRDEVDFLDKLWAYGNQISLRPQQRVLLSDADEVVVLRHGFLAVDATPTKGKSCRCWISWSPGTS